MDDWLFAIFHSYQDEGGGGVGAGVIKNCLQKNPVNQVKASSTNYSRPSLSRLRLSGITAYLEEKI